MPFDHYEIHELAALIPEMSADEFRGLCDDIRTNGLIEPIVLYEDRVLDGRHRYRACIETGIEPRFEYHVGDDASALAYVLSTNIARRHLSVSQRSIVALNVLEYERACAAARMRHEDALDGTATLPSPDGRPAERWERTAAARAAESVGVSASSIERAARVAEAAPELLPQIASGALTVADAARRVRRAEHEARVAHVRETMTAPEPLEGVFQVVYADPPWRYDEDISNVPPWGVELQYPTMHLDDICSMADRGLVPADDDAILFMWGTSTKLPEAFRVIDAWGFTYKQSMIWDKMVPGMGSWVLVEHELLFIATKGHIATPPPTARPRSVVHSQRSGHSVKPDVFYDIIENMYPDARKVELFARRARNGWAAWGAEAPDEGAA